MRALVVHESMFGNTETVARAVADGLVEAGAEVRVESVREAAADLGGVDLLVVGGPTHAFGMSRASTRADAVTKGATAEAAAGPGIREWIDDLDPATTAVACFDTRVRRPRVPGSAARAARKRLRAKGLDAVGPATTFWVDGMDGPLVDGEAGRARRWGTELAAAVSERSGTSR